MAHTLPPAPKMLKSKDLEICFQNNLQAKPLRVKIEGELGFLWNVFVFFFFRAWYLLIPNFHTSLTWDFVTTAFMPYWSECEKNYSVFVFVCFLSAVPGPTWETDHCGKWGELVAKTTFAFIDQHHVGCVIIQTDTKASCFSTSGQENQRNKCEGMRRETTFSKRTQHWGVGCRNVEIPHV